MRYIVCFTTEGELDCTDVFPVESSVHPLDLSKREQEEMFYEFCGSRTLAKQVADSGEWFCVAEDEDVVVMGSGEVKQKSRLKKFLLYLARWELSSIVLAPCLAIFGGLGVVVATIIANAIGACIFFFVDKHIFRESTTPS